MAQFIGSPKMNFFTGKMAEKYKAHTVGVRPEHLEIRKSGGAWTGKVIHSEILGADSYIYVDIGGEEPAIVREDGKSTYHTGDSIGFSPKGNLYHLFDKDGQPMAVN